METRIIKSEEYPKELVNGLPDEFEIRFDWALDDNNAPLFAKDLEANFALSEELQAEIYFRLESPVWECVIGGTEK